MVVEPRVPLTDGSVYRNRGNDRLCHRKNDPQENTECTGAVNLGRFFNRRRKLLQKCLDQNHVVRLHDGWKDIHTEAVEHSIGTIHEIRGNQAAGNIHRDDQDAIQGLSQRHLLLREQKAQKHAGEHRKSRTEQGAHQRIAERDAHSLEFENLGIVAERRVYRNEELPYSGAGADRRNEYVPYRIHAQKDKQPEEQIIEAEKHPARYGYLHHFIPPYTMP